MARGSGSELPRYHEERKFIQGEWWVYRTQIVGTEWGSERKLTLWREDYPDDTTTVSECGTSEMCLGEAWSQHHQIEYDPDWDRQRENPKKIKWTTVEWLKLPSKIQWTAHWSYVVDQEYERLRGSGFTLYCLIPEGGELGVYRESQYGVGIAYEHETVFVEEEACFTSEELLVYLSTLMRNAQTSLGSADFVDEDDFYDAVDQYGLAFDIFRNLKFELIGAPEILEDE